MISMSSVDDRIASVLAEIEGRAGILVDPDRPDVTLEPGQNADETLARTAANVRLIGVEIDEGRRNDWLIHVYRANLEAFKQGLRQDPASLRSALVALAALVVAWVAALDE